MTNNAHMQETTREQVRRQEAAISRLHQRSRECFRDLKAAAAAHPAQQTCIPLQDKELLTQPTDFPTADCRAGVQPIQLTQGVQREQQTQVAVPALQSQGNQLWSASPVKGTAVPIFHLTVVCHHGLSPMTMRVAVVPMLHGQNFSISQSSHLDWHTKRFECLSASSPAA